MEIARSIAFTGGDPNKLGEYEKFKADVMLEIETKKRDAQQLAQERSKEIQMRQNAKRKDVTRKYKQAKKELEGLRYVHSPFVSFCNVILLVQLCTSTSSQTGHKCCGTVPCSLC